jgi:dienelactone hydrolase
LSKLSSFADRLFDRIRAGSTPGWRGARFGLLALSVLLIAAVAYFQVEQSNRISTLLGVVTLLAAIMLASITLHLLLWSFGLQPNSNKLLLIFTFVLVAGIGLPVWGLPGNLVPAAILVLLISLACGGFAALRAAHFSLHNMQAVIALAVGTAGLAVGIFLALKPIPNPNPWLDQVIRQDQTLDLPDPGERGDYEFETFTYGSGQDRYRDAFGSDVTYITPSVNGSNMVSGWDGIVGRTRTAFWGFDHTALPVQAYVWAPKGRGPFPLILMVHGGHQMEDFSELGYAYLGEHFASQGMIAVSVDENFLNPSASGLRNPLAAGIGPENDARGWMLLKHLEQWRSWTRDDNHPLFGKADLDRIALIGHSRGGEAVTIAANFNSLDHYPDNAAEHFDFEFGIKALIAISPIDGQYNPRGSNKTLRDISYFTIAGSMDSDMESFMGSSQMSRVTLTGQNDAIKASLYIEGANHGEFNTNWSWADRGLPFSWLLNRGGFMDGADQRQIARVYCSAFLDSALYDRTRYWPVLGDPQKAASWLPADHMLANFVTSRRQVLADFEGDMELSREAASGVSITTQNLIRWSEAMILLKWSPLDTHAAKLAWDRSVDPATASYELAWPPGSFAINEDSLLVFAASDANESAKPLGRTPSGNDAATAPASEADTAAGLDWNIIVTDRYGNEATLPLTSDSPLYPQIRASRRIFEGLASIAKSEVVWRRFEFPVRDFVEMNPDLLVEELASIRFEFAISPSGSILLDDIGFE